MKREALARLADVALAAASDAGALVRSAWRGRPAVEHKGAVDLVTAWDRESEALLRARLAPTGIPLVGEEYGGERPRAGLALWIDPIDGTTNFVHGHPFWCVSVGLSEDGAPVLGVVVAPALQTTWVGLVPDDAPPEPRRDGAPCAVSATARLEDALLATGFPYDRRTSPDNNFDTFVAIKRRCQAIRRCGSAALDLCLVADGTYDGYWERKLNPWDLAGGAALVRAAGGTVTDPDGASDFLGSGHVVASNGALHDALLDELRASAR